MLSVHRVTAQAKSKSSQVRASSSKARTKLSQRKSFDFLRRIEPYQGVTPTPRAFFILAPFPAF
jgi:hypothetical protein